MADLWESQARNFVMCSLVTQPLFCTTFAVYWKILLSRHWDAWHSTLHYRRDEVLLLLSGLQTINGVNRMLQSLCSLATDITWGPPQQDRAAYVRWELTCAFRQGASALVDLVLFLSMRAKRNTADPTKDAIEPMTPLWPHNTPEL